MPNRNLDDLKASDGTGEAVMANIEADRGIGAVTLNVDSVDNWPQTFIFATGTKNANNYIDPSTMTIMYGHLDSGNIVIDDYAPGYSDNGNTDGQVAIIKPNSYAVDELIALLEIAHNNDGSIQETAIYSAIGTKGVKGDEVYFTSSGTWTKPTNLKFVIVEVQGAGGGGGGADSSAGNSSCAGGGGGGGYSKKKILAADLGSTETVTVGTGGSGATGGNAAGSAGGSSSFGSHATGGGGGGGNAGVDTGTFTSYGQDSGTPGSGTGGDINIDGGYGENGLMPRSSSTLGSTGGSSVLGANSARESAGNLSKTGPAGKLYGGGGAGGLSSGASTSNGDGGAGAAGIVIVHEYF